MASATISAVSAEAAALGNVAAGLTRADLALPTPCPPWTVADLLSHVIIAMRRIGQAMAEPGDVPSSGSQLTAFGYYRADQRFSAAVNDDRIATAQALAARLGPEGIAAELDRSCAEGCQLLEQRDRIIRTRHGDSMLLTEFARTRVVELGVHGLDVAIALSHEPWLMPQAAAVLMELLLPPGAADPLRARFGVGDAGLIARLTGRASLSAAERTALDTAGIALLPMG